MYGLRPGFFNTNLSAQNFIEEESIKNKVDSSISEFNADLLLVDIH